MFVPSIYQQNFFDCITNEDCSIVLEAVAGSGKTTTLIEALVLMKGTKFFGAYNKSIATEIATKTAARNIADLVVSTMHAAGFKAWLKVAKNCKVDNFKCRNIFRATFTEDDDAMFETSVCSLVSYAKQAAIGVNNSVKDVSVWYDLIEHFNIDTLEDDAKVVELAKKVLEISNGQATKIIDFDDMIYCPVINHVKIQTYKWVIIDEAQDTNAARRAFALMMLERGGRLIAVGDKHQAIYGFTGADADALDLIADAVSAKKMPLTVSYRCPKSVVEHAHNFVKHIEAHENAIEGSVSNIKIEDIVKHAKPGDAILCRFNAPVIKLVYRFIAEGISAKVEGREIGNGLKAVVRRWKVKTFNTLNDRLDTYKDKEVAKYRAKEKESMAVAIEDKVECIKTLIDRVKKIDPNTTDPIGRLCSEIDSIFDNDVSSKSVTLSSIHKSKGREWENVFYLQTGASKWARKEWEKGQELNLQYVATTRAMKNLILVAMEEK